MRFRATVALLLGIAPALGGCLSAGGRPPPEAYRPRAQVEFMTLENGVRHHLPTDTAFPARYDTLPMVSAGNRGPDAQVGYAVPEGHALTFFLFRPADRPELVIERGIGSELVENEYRRNTAGFAELERMGMFENLTYVLTNAQIDLTTRSGPLPARLTILRYSLPSRPGVPLIGLMVFTGYQNRFLKIRYSYPDPSPEDLPTDPEQRKAQLVALGAVNMLVATVVLRKAEEFLH